MLIDQIKENGFTLKKGWSRQYSTKSITNADYADGIELFANTPTQAESLLHSLEQAAGDINFHVNADKTEYMCFNQEDDNSTLNSSFLKLVNKFTYLGSSVLTIENDINMSLSKDLDGNQSNQTNPIK